MTDWHHMDIPHHLAWIRDEDPAELIASAPERLREIAEHIGTENVLKLVFWFSGMNVYIPKAEEAFRASRDRRIRREFEAMEPVETLARRYALTTGAVYGICRKLNPQQGLFDVTEEEHATQATTT